MCGRNIKTVSVSETGWPKRQRLEGEEVRHVMTADNIASHWPLKGFQVSPWVKWKGNVGFWAENIANLILLLHNKYYIIVYVIANYEVLYE